MYIYMYVNIYIYIYMYMYTHRTPASKGVSSRAQVVDILLMRGARARIRTVWGETPVGLAVELGIARKTSTPSH